MNRSSGKGLIISKCPFLVHGYAQKPTILRISALASKKRSIQKKIRALYTRPLIRGFHFDSLTLVFLFDLVLEARAEIPKKNSVFFLVETMTPKGHIKIN